jgi:SAM-dependent methyltransferase
VCDRTPRQMSAMERIPEPELMNDEAQARAYAEADFAEPHTRFVTLLRELLPELPVRGAALDLGCGPADVTVRVARALPGWTVDGLDGSAAMLRYGQAAVARAGLAQRVTLLRAYLPEATAPRPTYDLVFSNSLLHHLHDPLSLWHSVKRWAGPGSAVFVMDLLRPPSGEAASRLVETYAASEPAILRRDFLHSLLAAYRVDEVEQQVALAGLARCTVRAVSDRHLIVWGRF